MIEGAVQFIAYVCGLVEYLVAEFTGFTEFTELQDCWQFAGAASLRFFP